MGCAEVGQPSQPSRSPSPRPRRHSAPEIVPPSPARRHSVPEVMPQTPPRREPSDDSRDKNLRRPPPHTLRSCFTPPPKMQELPVRGSMSDPADSKAAQAVPPSMKSPDAKRPQQG